MKQNKNKENAIILMNSLNIVSRQFINKRWAKTFHLNLCCTLIVIK